MEIQVQARERAGGAEQAIAVGRMLQRDEILALVPQQPPFRFVDRLLHVDEQGVVAEACFDPDAFFYRGHFPGHPVTPGVILVEAMAQAGIVTHALFLIAERHGLARLRELMPAFTDASVEFLAPVAPGMRVRIESQLEFFRFGKIRSRVSLTRPDGTRACSGVLGGIGLRR